MSCERPHVCVAAKVITLLSYPCVDIFITVILFFVAYLHVSGSYFVLPDFFLSNVGARTLFLA